jgi:CRISPR system Cascade subunit CasA
MTTKSFHLINEPWVPVAGYGKASLRDIFSRPEYKALGGNPVQKIALMKLLLAIAQSAYTPADDADWCALQPKGMANRCLAYLEKWQDRFDLYGEKPFLQIPAIQKANIQRFAAVRPEIATGNTTVLTSLQIERILKEDEKALLLLQLMGFALGGKKTDNQVVLSAGYAGKTNEKGKPSTGSSGPAIGFKGYLHNFVQSETLLQTLWINLFTAGNIADMKSFPNGLGVAPWEQMPAGEDCTIAQSLKQSLMGRLIPLSRFCLLTEDGLHYSEGIAHASHKDSMCDPSVSVNHSGKNSKVLWVDPEKRPWRELTALLSFFNKDGKINHFDCPQLSLNLQRCQKILHYVMIWSGGLAVSSNAGEQYVSGSDDFLESLIKLETKNFGDYWFQLLKQEMEALESLSKTIYATTLAYYKSLNAEGKDQAKASTHLFWQLCEREFQDLLNACNTTGQASLMRARFVHIAERVYSSFCPNDTTRQMDAWAKNYPNFHKYYQPSSKKEAA